MGTANDQLVPDLRFCSCLVSDTRRAFFRHSKHCALTAVALFFSVMKLDATAIRYLTAIEWRVLVAVEMGMKNHELVPVVLIVRIANLRRHGIQQTLSNLLKHKLISHDRSVYDGYKLTYLGYDFLALRAVAARESVLGIGMRMGVGKESDVHICEGANGRRVILKLHRLGRISFRSVKKNRDYLGNRQSASWMYLARLAAAKEFAYMKALYEHGFPVPEPLDLSRHAIVMAHVDARPLAQVRELEKPERVLEELMCLIVRFAESGLIHGDFNAFNLLLHDDEHVTVIDFPQIVGVHHPDAEYYFDRDVQCIRSLFRSRFGIEVTDYPRFRDVRLPPVERSLSRLAEQPQDEERRLREEFEAYRQFITENQDAEVSDATSEDSSAATADTPSSALDTLTDTHPRFASRPSSPSARVTADRTHSPPETPCHPLENETSDACHLPQDNRASSIPSPQPSETGSSDDADGTSETSDADSLDDHEDPDTTYEPSTMPPKRLDNVWTPIIRRRTADTAKKHVATAEKKKARARIGNAGRKRNSERRKLRDALHDW